MYSTSIHQKPPPKTPIYSKFKKRPVGTVYPSRAVFRKTIKGSRHLLRQPPAIAFDISTLQDAQAAGATWCEVEDLETLTTYRAKIEHIFEKGTKFNRGWGDQIYLEIPNGWIVTTKPVQLGMFEGVAA